MVQSAAGLVPELTPRDAHERVASGAHLLDVREPLEWEAGHAPGARHVPLGSLTHHVHSLPVDADLLVVCRSGGRSVLAATALQGAGFRAINVAGGMQSWEEAGLPVVTDAGTPGCVL